MMGAVYRPTHGLACSCYSVKLRERHYLRIRDRQNLNGNAADNVNVPRYEISLVVAMLLIAGCKHKLPAFALSALPPRLSTFSDHLSNPEDITSEQERRMGSNVIIYDVAGRHDSQQTYYDIMPLLVQDGYVVGNFVYDPKSARRVVPFTKGPDRTILLCDDNNESLRRPGHSEVTIQVITRKPALTQSKS